MTRAPALSTECRLVFATAPIDPDLAVVAECLATPLDWGRVIALAERERATLPLWRALNAAGASRVPAPVAEHLRASAMVYEFRLLRLGSRLERTIALFRERGIPVMLLKGSALVATVYGAFTQRPMSDLDLLVHPEDAARASAALVDAGWPQTTDPALVTLLQDEHHLPPFYDTEPTGLRVELHTRCLPTEQPFAFSEEEFWRESASAPAPFLGASVASPVHLLHHAALHFAWSHTMRFGAWRMCRDASALLAGGTFDWDGLIGLAQRSRSVTCVYWSLRLTERLAGIALPPGVLERLTPPTPAAIRDALERHFISAIAPGESPPCPSSRLDHLLWRVALRPAWSGHARPGRWDPEHRWERTMGTTSTESAPDWAVRHARGFRHWWQFASRTLAARD